MSDRAKREQQRKDYESKLLGQILVSDHNEIWHQLTVTDQHFTGRNKAIYNAIAQVIARGDDAKLDTVYAQDRSIDPSYLASLTDNVITSANFSWYEQQLIEADRVANLHRVAAELPERLVKGSSAAFDWVFGELDRISQTRRSDTLHAAQELIHDYTNVIEQRYKLGGKLPGLQTGFSDLDKMLLGWQQSRLYYVCGRPSDGKSALLLNSATHLGYWHKMPFVYLSLESSRTEIFDRMAAQLGKIDSETIQRGEFKTKADFEKFMNVAGDIYEMPMYLYDVPNQSINEVKAVARRAVNVYGANIVYIDYLQLIRVPGADGRTEQVATASMELKDLSRELQVPIVCAAQLRREADERDPHLGDIQWASQAEQDADAAILIHRKTDKKTGQKSHRLIVAKNRDGRVGSIPVTFVGQYVMFAPSADDRAA